MQKEQVISILSSTTDVSDIERYKHKFSELTDIEAFNILKVSKIADALVPYFAKNYANLNRFAISNLLINKLTANGVLPYVEEKIRTFEKSTLTDILSNSPVGHKIVPIIKEQLKKFDKGDVMQFVNKSPVAHKLIPMFDCLSDLSDNEVASLFKINGEPQNLIPLFEDRLKKMDGETVYSILIACQRAEQLLDVFKEHIDQYDAYTCLHIIDRWAFKQPNQIYPKLKHKFDGVGDDIVADIFKKVYISDEIVEQFKFRIPNFNPKELRDILMLCNNPSKVLKYADLDALDKYDVFFIMCKSYFAHEMVGHFKNQLSQLDHQEISIIMFASPITSELRNRFIELELM